MHKLTLFTFGISAENTSDFMYFAKIHRAVSANGNPNKQIVISMQIYHNTYAADDIYIKPL